MKVWLLRLRSQLDPGPSGRRPRPRRRCGNAANARRRLPAPVRLAGHDGYRHGCRLVGGGAHCCRRAGTRDRGGRRRGRRGTGSRPRRPKSRLGRAATRRPPWWPRPCRGRRATRRAEECTSRGGSNTASNTTLAAAAAWRAAAPRVAFGGIRHPGAGAGQQPADRVARIVINRRFPSWRQGVGSISIQTVR